MRTSLEKAVYNFYLPVKNKELLNAQKLSYQSRLIGTAAGTNLFLLLLNAGVFQLEPSHAELVNKNLVLFSLVYFFSAFGVYTAVASFTDHFAQT